jgi:cell division transport system permease protein
MIFTTFKRITRTGFVNFWRNGFLSFSAIVMVTLSLLAIGAIIFTSAFGRALIADVEEKVDINVYFVSSAPEEDVLSLQKTLEGLPEVSAVTYVSREQALQDFKTRHQNDQFTLQALSELDDNPLGAVLNIKAKDPSQYEGISQYLENKPILSKDGASIVDKVNYNQNRNAIEQLSSIIKNASKLGSIVTLILVIVSILITLNTIRLAIYISREEISVMRLVGASNFYVWGPFVVVGMIYGAISGVLTLLLFYPITYWLGGASQSFFIGFNVFAYYTRNFGQIFLIVMGSGIIIGAISSYLAVRKYLKV